MSTHLALISTLPAHRKSRSYHHQGKEIPQSLLCLCALVVEQPSWEGCFFLVAGMALPHRTLFWPTIIQVSYSSHVDFINFFCWKEIAMLVLTLPPLRKGNGQKIKNQPYEHRSTSQRKKKQLKLTHVLSDYLLQAFSFKQALSACLEIDGLNISSRCFYGL